MVLPSEWQKDTKRLHRDVKLTPDLLLSAYASGVFPMADPDEDDTVYWYAPDPRAIIPLDRFRTTRSLRSKLRRQPFDLTVDTAFRQVMEKCADREETWISAELKQVYGQLFDLGYAHSIEARSEGRLVGGLYGVSLGGAFFGESMFSIEADASKIALVFLVDRLRASGFILLDIQFMTDHLRQFGAVEIPKRKYEQKLERALEIKAVWN